MRRHFEPVLIVLTLLCLVLPVSSSAGGVPEKGSVAAAEVLRARAEAAHDDPDLFARAATAYGEAKLPLEALELQQRAVQLRPDDPWLLMSQGNFATWTTHYTLAEASYRRSLALNPDNAQGWLELARVQSWQSKLDDSAYSYSRSLALAPRNSEALLESARVHSQRGDYARGLEAIDAYREVVGDDADYRRVRSEILAWGNRPDAALELTGRGLELLPNDAALVCTEAVAWNRAREFRRSLKRLDDCAALRPSSGRVEGLRAVLESSLGPIGIRGIRPRSPYRPDYDWEHLNLSRPVGMLDGHYRGATDEIDAAVESGVAFQFPLDPELIVGATAGYEHLWADLNSGFDTNDQERDDGYGYAAGELEMQVVERIWLGARAGVDITDDGDVSPRYRVALDVRPADAFEVAIVQENRLFSYSPRTVSRETEINSTHLLVRWTPDLRYRIEAGGEYDSFSDDNSAWGAFIAPQRAVVRRQHLAIDLGLRGQWWGFEDQGFEDQGFENGYYDPEFFQRYVATMQLSATPREKIAVNLFASAGVGKDESNSVEPVGDLFVEGIFGFYGDWMLKARAGVSATIRSGGDYMGWMTGLRLIRRF